MLKTVFLKFNPTPFDDTLSEFSEALANIPSELVDSILMLFENPLNVLDFECHATSADEVTVVFKPTDGLLNFLSAIRARNTKDIILNG
jgi:hypothetical protein